MGIFKAKICVACSLAGLLTLAVLGAATGTNTRVALRSEVEVTSDKLTLSDLFPLSAPPNLRETASGISLGNSPQPGALRTILSGEIQRLTDGEPQMIASLSVPERIVISRSHRKLTH